ncbi:hypothetical protein MBGDF03_00603 [Thermoplasmatales archaeon SCGC AB-540-F20]|nr:hypothetical protein MBGDF03_00603 [Thermoplasmatales archaeon SCGC AB-540-F20]
MARRKLSNKQIKNIQKLLKEGHKPKDVAKKYGVHISVIYRRAKYDYQARGIPVDIKNKIAKAIKDGYTKAEAAQLYNLNIGTVYNLTRELGINGYRTQGNHIVRKNGIKLLNRLMTDGYLISDFNVPVVRNLQQKFPVIRSARFKDKTFFYLKRREEETIEAYFREKPDRIISYRAIEEMAYLLGVKVSNMDQRKLLERYKRKHDAYWRSRRLIQRRMEEFDPDCIFPHKKEQAESGFRLFPKVKYKEGT